jgi:hypothetical protein
MAAVRRQANGDAPITSSSCVRDKGHEAAALEKIKAGRAHAQLTIEASHRLVATHRKELKPPAGTTFPAW